MRKVRQMLVLASKDYFFSPFPDETMLSPIVMCGPHGVKFDVPVELRLPHHVAVDSETSSVSLKLGDTQNGKAGQRVNRS